MTPWGELHNIVVLFHVSKWLIVVRDQASLRFQNTNQRAFWHVPRVDEGLYLPYDTPNPRNACKDCRFPIWLTSIKSCTVVCRCMPSQYGAIRLPVFFAFFCLSFKFPLNENELVEHVLRFSRPFACKKKKKAGNGPGSNGLSTLLRLYT